MSQNKLVFYCPDADLRMGYDGLTSVARKAGVDLSNLPLGHYAAFVNRAQNKVKLCTQNDVTAYLRLRKGRLDPRVIQHLPNYFNGGEIAYDKAMAKMLRQQFPEWFKPASA